MKTEGYIEITPGSVILNGKAIKLSETGSKMLVELYRRFVGDYPKFFKMDTLCRLGFVAAEMLLKKTTNDQTVNDQTVNAVILANRSASIKNDNDYLATISEGHYYPSPSLFVYTLPNIVTGEIAIRHHIRGETSFYILDRPEQLEPIVRATLASRPSNLPHADFCILAGWCECRTADDYYAKIQLITDN